MPSRRRSPRCCIRRAPSGNPGTGRGPWSCCVPVTAAAGGTGSGLVGRNARVRGAPRPRHTGGPYPPGDRLRGPLRALKGTGMTGHTHANTGAAAGALAADILRLPVGLQPLTAALGTLAALLPDVDAPESTVNRRLGAGRRAGRVGPLGRAVDGPAQPGDGQHPSDGDGRGAWGRGKGPSGCRSACGEGAARPNDLGPAAHPRGGTAGAVDGAHRVRRPAPPGPGRPSGGGAVARPREGAGGCGECVGRCGGGGVLGEPDGAVTLRQGHPVRIGQAPPRGWGEQDESLQQAMWGYADSATPALSEAGTDIGKAAHDKVRQNPPARASSAGRRAEDCHGEWRAGRASRRNSRNPRRGMPVAAVARPSPARTDGRQSVPRDEW